MRGVGRGVVGGVWEGRGRGVEEGVGATERPRQHCASLPLSLRPTPSSRLSVPRPPWCTPAPPPPGQHPKERGARARGEEVGFFGGRGGERELYVCGCVCVCVQLRPFPAAAAGVPSSSRRALTLLANAAPRGPLCLADPVHTLPTTHTRVGIKPIHAPASTLPRTHARDSPQVPPQKTEKNGEIEQRPFGRPPLPGRGRHARPG